MCCQRCGSLMVAAATVVTLMCATTSCAEAMVAALTSPLRCCLMSTALTSLAEVVVPSSTCRGCSLMAAALRAAWPSCPYPSLIVSMCPCCWKITRCCPALAAAVTSTTVLRAMWPCPWTFFCVLPQHSSHFSQCFLLAGRQWAVAPFFFLHCLQRWHRRPPLMLSVDVDVRLTLCFNLLGSAGLLFVGVLLNFSVCLLLMMWWLRKHLLCHLQLFTLIGINTISWRTRDF